MAKKGKAVCECCLPKHVWVDDEQSSSFVFLTSARGLGRLKTSLGLKEVSMTGQSGESKSAANRENAEAMVEKYRRMIQRRLENEEAIYCDASDLRGWCGVSEKDRLRGDFVLRAIRLLVKEGALISQRGGLFKRGVVSEDEDVSEDDATETAHAEIDQEASVLVDELVETEVPEDAIVEAEPSEASAASSDRDDEPEDSDDAAPAPNAAEQPVSTKRRRSPRGGFRAWAIAYMKPNVIFQTKELLRLALEAGACTTRAAGQLQLNRLVTEGVLTRKRRGYVTLTAAMPIEAGIVNEALPPSPIAEPPSEAPAEPAVVAPASEADATRAEEDAPVVTPKKRPVPKRPAKKAAAKKVRASKPDLLVRLPKIFGKERVKLLALLKSSGRERKEIVGLIRRFEACLAALDARTARARAMIDALDRGITALVALERSLRPSKR